MFLVVLAAAILAPDARSSSAERDLAVLVSHADLAKREEAFLSLVGAGPAVVPILRRELESWPTQGTPDRLNPVLYVIAARRERAVIPIIEKMRLAPDAEERFGCLYACPLDFAATVLGLEPYEPAHCPIARASGPAIDRQMAEVATKTLPQLMALLLARDTDYDMRLAAGEEAYCRPIGPEHYLDLVHAAFVTYVQSRNDASMIPLGTVHALALTALHRPRGP